MYLNARIRNKIRKKLIKMYCFIKPIRKEERLTDQEYQYLRAKFRQIESLVDGIEDDK